MTQKTPLRRGRTTAIAWAIFYALVLTPIYARAESAAVDELIEILQQTSRLQGTFEQRQYDANDVLLAESSGHFKMLRPGYFSWEIEAPDSQLIVANPEYIWHHDKDLETVTRRPVTDSGVLSPLQILGGREELLRSQFSVSKSANGIFTLVPNQSEPGFSRLALTLEGAVITGMEIIDALDQRVVIQFREVGDSSALSEQDFAFIPPDGVDLFYYDQ